MTTDQIRLFANILVDLGIAPSTVIRLLRRMRSHSGSDVVRALETYSRTLERESRRYAQAARDIRSCTARCGDQA